MIQLVCLKKITLDCVLTRPLANRECVDNLIFVEFLVAVEEEEGDGHAREEERKLPITHYFLPHVRSRYPHASPNPPSLKHLNSICLIVKFRSEKANGRKISKRISDPFHLHLRIRVSFKH